MKQVRIVQAVLLLATTALLVSCGSGRHTVYDAPYPPPSRAHFSLILNATPGMVIHRHHTGRYYYRHPAGYTYWRGPGNRYYLDRSHMGKVKYNRHEYNRWKRYYR